MRIERDQVQTVAALAVMILVAVVGLWMPAHMRENRLRQTIAEAKAQCDMVSGDNFRPADLAKEVANLRKRTQEGQYRCVPQEPQLADLLKDLSTDLAALRVTDQETQSQATLSGGDFSVIPVTLHFRGSFRAVYEFLTMVESMRRLVRVTRLEVLRPADAAVQGDTESGREPVGVNIELCTFFTAPEAGKS